MAEPRGLGEVVPPKKLRVKLWSRCVAINKDGGQQLLCNIIHNVLLTSCHVVIGNFLTLPTFYTNFAYAIHVQDIFTFNCCPKFLSVSPPPMTMTMNLKPTGGSFEIKILCSILVSLSHGRDINFRPRTHCLLALHLGHDLK